MSVKKHIILLEILFLLLIYASGLYFRLLPRLEQDSHLLTFEADIWYRITMAQYVADHGHLPDHDIRYEAYGYVPFWYPPLGLYVFSALHQISGLDIPTVSSRVIPFLEALAPLSIYIFCRILMGMGVAFLATLFLALTPSFVFWTGISDPQSFILFMIPIILLIWIKHAQWSTDPQQHNGWRILRIFLLGFLLAVCFLTHLFFFLIVCLLIMVSLALFLEKIRSRKIWLDLMFVLLISQLATCWWWGPKNLYWWWLMSIVTSSGLYPGAQQIKNFGVVAAIVGGYFLLMLFVRTIIRRKHPIHYAWVIIFWALIPFLETQNENILLLINRLDLSWSTIVKPLEGFRFFCFLAQPLAVAVALMSIHFLRLAQERMHRWIIISFISLIFILMLTDIHVGYDFKMRILNSGFNHSEIVAAEWFRENSKPDDRIIADYYRSQMFAGFSGGRALLGMAFPLRRVDYPYISQKNYSVAEDIFRIYTTDNPEEAVSLMKRYGATHLLVSSNMAITGNFITSQQQGFGIVFNYNVLQNRDYFETVYEEEGQVVILKRLR
ncbi:MAG: glycosyltransferase family 39 protein [Chlamydiota bacterium]|nr:glycosyltransferase family 39 protein [Chlamydiota bacterium]